MGLYINETPEFHDAELANAYSKLLEKIMGTNFRFDIHHEIDHKGSEKYYLKFEEPLLKTIHNQIISNVHKQQNHSEEQPFVEKRVFAVQNSDNEKVCLFGFGRYVGDYTPDDETGGLSHIVTGTNPKIILDSGEVVWGCECWWGPEELFHEEYGHLEVVHVSISDFRTLSRGENN